MTRIPLYLMLLMLPLAVAGHNIGAGVATLGLFFLMYRRRGELKATARELWRTQRVPLVASFGYVALLLAAGMTNPAMAKAGTFVWGYWMWLCLPPLAFLAQGALGEKHDIWVARCAAFVAAFMGVIAIFQAIYGFKMVGTSFVDGSTRAQGFYSHPLTFAYVGLLLFGLGCGWTFARPREPGAWAMSFGGAAVVFASQSRMVQAVAAVLVVANVALRLRGRVRVAALAALVVLGTVLATTDNPVRYRFSRTLAGIDVRSGYGGDDRVAFWHAHWLMLRERPLLGHGENTNTAYRKPYYEAIGLGSFERQYEAHNMYLQAAVNGGLLGLLAMLAWYAWHLALAAAHRHHVAGQAAFQALAALGVAALTQNAFQDSEVRYAITLVAVMLWLLPRPEPEAVLKTARQAA